MTAEISFRMAMDVTMSWDKLKRISNYHDVAGELIFERVFELKPSAKKMFGFTDEEDLRANPSFIVHARRMVDMIDMAVGFLGPDLDPLAEDLIELGRRHVGYGVEAAYLPIMGDALDFALNQVLGDQFTASDKKSWNSIFKFMISNMEIGMTREKK